jgi:hypothetical protein
MIEHLHDIAARPPCPNESVQVEWMSLNKLRSITMAHPPLIIIYDEEIQDINIKGGTKGGL